VGGRNLEIQSHFKLGNDGFRFEGKGAVYFVGKRLRKGSLGVCERKSEKGRKCWPKPRDVREMGNTLGISERVELEGTRDAEGVAWW